jgi:lipopolysaccharide transport system permease protein
MFRQYVDLIKFRAVADMKLEGSQSYLGVIWLILDPLLYLAVFYVLFEVLMMRGTPGFIGFALCGLVFWRWFDSSVKRASGSINGNSSIINQVYVYKLVFPIIEVVANTCRFSFILVLFIIFVIFYRQGISINWLALPAVLFVQLILSAGIGSLLALIVPFFPDLRKLIDNILMFFFFLSGVFFDINELDPDVQKYLYLNPMAVLLQQYRLILLDDQLPNWGVLIIVVSLALSLLALAVYMVNKLDMVYPRVMR